MSSTANLEVIVLPVSDVDRAKEFYARLDWRLDADRSTGDAFRLVQFTPPAELGGARLSQQSHLLQSARPRWPFRCVGATAALFRSEEMRAAFRSLR
jgi:catechol 2,3-dioxygenase-like lactoylglutathione lyase family enzyme